MIEFNESKILRGHTILKLVLTLLILHMDFQVNNLFEYKHVTYQNWGSHKFNRHKYELY